MKKFGALVVAIACFALALCLAGCGSQAKQVELQVFAANSLEKALPEVQELYTKANSNVTFADTQFKSSGDLVAELEGGASADLLITASAATMDKAEQGGYTDADTRATMFVNDLVVITAEDSDITISSLEDLASDKVKSIAIGEPNAVPAGKYAVQSLAAAGLATITDNADGTITVEYADSIKDKINAGADKVGTVASYVAEGQCEVGLVYTSDLYRYDSIKSIYTVPADMHKNIVYPGAVVADTENADTAADFLKFCMEDEGALEVFQKYGFELAEE